MADDCCPLCSLPWLTPARRMLRGFLGTAQPNHGEANFHYVFRSNEPVGEEPIFAIRPDVVVGPAVRSADELRLPPLKEDEEFDSTKKAGTVSSTLHWNDQQGKFWALAG